MKFRLIGAERAQHPVSLLCEVLGVSRSGFNAWLKRTPSKRWVSDVRLAELIRAIHAESDGTYGSPRIHAELRHRGVRVGRKRVERLMCRHSLSGLPKRRRGKTTVRVPGVRPAPDLVARDFRPAEPNRLWVADLTEVRTWEGKLYLAAVLDCFSRRVVGWAMAEHMRAELVVEALELAVSRRKPEAGLVHHSDQGSQGGFKWSSQRSIERSCGGHEERAEVGSGWSACDAVAGTSAGGAEGAPPAVLGGDRPRPVQRGRGGGGGLVGGGWCPVVSGGWRDAVCHARGAVGTVPVVRRAGGDRDLARSWSWGAGDRARAWSFAVHDLEGAASQCRDPWRWARVSGQHRAVACRPSQPASEARQARGEPRVAPVCAGPPMRCGGAARWGRRRRSSGRVDRPASRPAQGPTLGEVVEP